MKNYSPINSFRAGFLFLGILLNSGLSFAQCPGCVIDQGCTANPAAPALCPATLPDGTQGAAYNQDLTFFMPAQFTPAGIPLTVTLDSISVDNVTGLPPGLSWETSASPLNVFYPASNPPATERGCVKICGTPTAFGNFNMVVNVTAYANTPIGPQTQIESFSLPLLIIPPSGGNSSFTFTPALGCEPLDVTFQTSLTPTGFQLLTHDWNFGNGTSAQGSNPAAVTYSNAGSYYPELVSRYYDYVVTQVDVNVTGSACCGVFDEFGTGPDVYFSWDNGAGSQNSSVIDDTNTPSFTGLNITLTNASLVLSFTDEDVPPLNSNDELGQTTVNITGAGAYNFSTSELSGTLYVDTVLSFQVIGTDTIIVFPTPQAPVLSPSGPVTLCDGLVQTLSIPATTNQISWYLNDSTLLIGQTLANTDVTIGGTYSAVETSSDGCSAESNPVEVIFLPNPPVPVILQNGGALQTSAIGAIQWFFNGNPIPGANLQILFYGDSGTYSAQVTGANGCTSSASLYVPNPSGIEETEVNQLGLYPNPAKDELNISGLTSGKYEFFIHNAEGRLVLHEFFQTVYNSTQLKFPSDFSSGVYMLRCIDSKGKQRISRFVKSAQ